MSADNGIYILRNPKKDNPNEFEFRVTQCSAIDNIDTSCPGAFILQGECKYHIGNIYEVLLFGKSVVFDDKLKAIACASDIEDDNHDHGDYTEYGIRTIYREEPFPEIPYDYAKELYDQYFMS